MGKLPVSEDSQSSHSELTRGHKKKARTRQHLIEAALRIYAQKGAGELALNELAEEAGVSNGTVYNYFRTREDVLEAVGVSLAVSLSEQVSAVSTGVDHACERMAIGVRTFLRRAVEDPQWAGALIRVVRYAEGMRSLLAANIRADLRQGVTQGVFRYANEDLALALIVSATTGAMAAVLEGVVVDQHDSMVAEMILLALGATSELAKDYAYRSMPLA